MSETNEETSVESTNDTGEGESSEVDTLTIPKSDYEKLNQTLGSLKRELKDLKKTQDTPKETPQSNQKPDDALLQRMERLAFKQHNVSHEDDMELARKTAKKWGMDVEQVLEDEDFKVKLGKQQDSRTNVEATSNVRGSNSSQSSSKAKADYWIGKNTAPSDEDVATNKIPREELSKIMGHFVTNKGSNKKFYND